MKVVIVLFDPTAFENIKVVVEGAVYDRDLDGEILVTDREDLVNLAKLSRKFSISFTLRHHESSHIHAVLTLESGLQNLAAELLGTDQSLHLAGCAVTVGFRLRHPNEDDFFREIQMVLERIWGRDRTVRQTISINPLEKELDILNEVTVTFNRLVLEDQIEDLAEMVVYIIASLKELETFV